MNIKTLDAEQYIDNPYGLIIPFSVIGKVEGEFDYTVFDSCLPLLDGRLGARIDDYLTDGFYDRVRAALSDTVRALGFEPDGELTRSYLLQYRTERACGEVFADTVRIDRPEDYVDRTGSDFENGAFPVFATLRDGQILSVCGVNGLLEDGVAEIAVHTVPELRRRGHARSAVCAMTAFLADRGYTTAYQCEPDNSASIALAGACGLALYSRDYHFVCYGRDD